VIIVDTSALLAMHDPREKSHLELRKIAQSRKQELIISPYVVAEFDYMISKANSADFSLRALNNLLIAPFELVQLTTVDFITATEVMAKYQDLNIGITDASLIALAARFETSKIMTLDRRHFSAMKLLSGKPVQMIPN
jgi:hypothetical protein